MSVLVYALTALVAPTAVVGQGKVAPLIHTEFYANVLQNKFNHNGFGVNHTCSGTYYSSLSQQKIRSDCTAAGYSSNNASEPSPTASNIISSLFDFSLNKNTVVTFKDFGSEPTCWEGPAGWIPPLPATFLRDQGAIWAGLEDTPIDGLCEKWQFSLNTGTGGSGGTFFTFFFNKYKVLTRFDFVAKDPTQGAVGVTNQFRNVVTGDKKLLPPSIFAPYKGGKCTNSSVSSPPKFMAEPALVGLQLN